MTITVSTIRPRAPGAKTLGALAVVGVVLTFSLSSTLVKRAESPGVLLAFWRMVTMSIVWNAYLWMTGRRVTIRDVRQAVVPGVFIGLNLAIFYAGATNNSVANAALIGSLSPFFIVPIGARLFREHVNPRALLFALLAFGGVALVLFSASPTGDASLRGNVFGLVAVLLWTAYIVSTRHFRGDMDVATFMATISPIAAVALLGAPPSPPPRHFRGDMDVATFMATISPIAAVAVLPIAIADGDVFGLSGKGWSYMLVLALLTGVAAHGLNVYAQKAIPI